MLTRLGDGFFMLPIAAALALALADYDRKSAFYWLGCLAGGLLVVLAGKLAFYMGFKVFGNPSGHTALTVSVMGAVVRYTPIFASRLMAAGIWGSCIILAFLVAVSRILIDAHTVLEVVEGGLIGASVIAVLYRHSLPQAKIQIPLVAWIVAACSMMTFVRSLTIEQDLETLGGMLISSLK